MPWDNKNYISLDIVVGPKKGRGGCGVTTASAACSEARCSLPCSGGFRPGNACRGRSAWTSAHFSFGSTWPVIMSLLSRASVGCGVRSSAGVWDTGQLRPARRFQSTPPGTRCRPTAGKRCLGWWSCGPGALRKSVLSRCWQDEYRILTIIAQQGAQHEIWGQWLGAVTHEDAGWPAPAWATGLTQRESFLILRKTIPL